MQDLSLLVGMIPKLRKFCKKNFFWIQGTAQQLLRTKEEEEEEEVEEDQEEAEAVDEKNSPKSVWKFFANF